MGKITTKTIKGGGTNSMKSGTKPCGTCKGTGRVPVSGKK